MSDTTSTQASAGVMRELLRAPDFPASIPRYLRTHTTDRDKLLLCMMGIALICCSVPRIGRLLDDEGGTCVGKCDIMRAFPNNREMQHYALGAVIGLSSSNPTLMHTLGEAGACVCVCDASRALSDDSELQRDAIWAMSHLVAEHDGNRMRLANEGAVELMVRTMTKFSDDAEVSLLPTFSWHAFWW